MRKEILAPKINSIWEDHFGSSVTRRIRFGSNNSVIIPLSSAETKTLFANTSPSLQVGGEMV